MAAPSKYYAFISYSRKDSKAAAWLQRRLEWFRFPVKLVPADRQPPHARFVRPIYRDKTSLEVTDQHYWTNIRRALEESRYLIVLCSPHAAASQPVDMEVAHFLQAHGGDASLVVPIIVSGNVTSAGPDAALGPALRQLGETLIDRNLPTMVPDAVTAEQDAWEHGFISLVSYLLRLERTALGDHIQRETKRQTRVLQRWLVAVGMLTVIAGASAWLAVRAKREVENANVTILGKNKEITEQNQINLKNLHEASMADYAVAVQRIEKDDKWHEGVAHLVRALKWEPGNALVAARLYSTLSLCAAEKQNWPRLNLRHEGAVWSAQFSPDGSRIVTASDNTVRVWDAATGQPLGEPLLHGGFVNSAQFSPDGSRIVTASDDKTARVWDAATGQALGEPLHHDDSVGSAQFSWDGSHIVTASHDETARIWDAATGQPLGEPLRHQSWVVSARFSPDGSRIVSASYDKTARVWDAATGQPLGEPLRHEGEVRCAEFSPEGSRIVTASYETARIWDAATSEALGEPLRHKVGVRSVQFSPDGSLIVTASFDKTTRVWDAATGQPRGEPLRHGGEVRSARFSQDGSRIVTTSFEDGSRVVATSSDKTARVWDTATGQPLGALLRQGGGVWSAQFNPDGSRIVIMSEDKTARIWDVATSLPLGAPLRHEGHVESAQYSPDGSRIVTASRDKTARVWDAATGQPIGEPLHHESWVVSALYSPDGSRIVTVSDSTARVWDAATRQPLGEPLRDEGGLVSAQFSPDGSRIVTMSDHQTARIWDVATGQALSKSLRHEDKLVSAQFSPDGSRVVTASHDKSARIWEAATGRPLGEPIRHPHSLKSAQFSPDSSRIVTASYDETAVRIWDAATGQPLGEPLRHQGAVNSAQFSPDGSRILTASDDHTARVWDAVRTAPLSLPVPKWIRERAGAVAGLRFSADGELQRIPSGERLSRLFDPAPGDDPGSMLARWLVLPATERTVTADSRFTRRQLAERERDTLLQKGLASALRFDPTVPLARILLAGTLLREDAQKESSERDTSLPQRAAFLRDYDLQRMPDDAGLWERAVRALHEQGDVERTGRALRKLEKLDQGRAAVVRGELGL